MSEKIMRLPRVLDTVGRSRAALYRLIAVGEFPRPIRVGPQAVGWLSSEIEAWINKRIVERDTSFKRPQQIAK